MKSYPIFSLSGLSSFAILAESGNRLGCETPKKANDCKPQIKANNCLLACDEGEVSSCFTVHAVSREKALPSDTGAAGTLPHSNISETMQKKNTKRGPQALTSKVTVMVSINTLNAAHSAILMTLREASATPEAESHLVDALAELQKKRKKLDSSLRWNLQRQGGCA